MWNLLSIDACIRVQGACDRRGGSAEAKGNATCLIQEDLLLNSAFAGEGQLLIQRNVFVVHKP